MEENSDSNRLGFLFGGGRLREKKVTRVKTDKNLSDKSVVFAQSNYLLRATIQG